MVSTGPFTASVQLFDIHRVLRVPLEKLLVEIQNISTLVINTNLLKVLYQGLPPTLAIDWKMPHWVVHQVDSAFRISSIIDELDSIKNKLLFS